MENTMAERNYKSKWWSYIYDQMMTQDLPDLLDAHLRFYRSNLLDCTGPVLECGCGTRLIFLPLLELGLDMYGFDISEAMLKSLKSKAEAQGFGNIDRRLSVQDLASFQYEKVFDTIIIPSNTFSMLITPEAQTKALKNIHHHLADQGVLLLDLHLVGINELAAGKQPAQGNWHIWPHPKTKRPIRQRVDGQLDFNNHLIVDHCYIEYDGHFADFPMIARWIFKGEFQLFLRLAGFAHWESFGTPEGNQLEINPDGSYSYWIIQKA
jgi:SAM-dependent methyltransferase